MLPDGKRVYKPLIPKAQASARRVTTTILGPRYVVPPHPLPEQNFYDESCDSPEMHYVRSEHERPVDVGRSLARADGSGWSMEGAEVITDQQ